MQIKADRCLETLCGALDSKFFFSGCACASNPAYFFSLWVYNHETLTSHRPSFQQQLHEFFHSSSVKCPTKTKALQQRTKQRGIRSPSPFWSCTPCNSQHNQTLTRCDTQHNQTLFWGYATKTNPALATPGAKESVGGAEEADVGKAKSSWCLC